MDADRKNSVFPRKHDRNLRKMSNDFDVGIHSEHKFIKRALPSFLGSSTFELILRLALYVALFFSYVLSHTFLLRFSASFHRAYLAAHYRSIISARLFSLTLKARVHWSRCARGSRRYLGHIDRSLFPFLPTPPSCR